MNISNQQSIAYSFYPIQPSANIYSKTQQRQTLIHSIKMIRFNQNSEQKTQYLETILRNSQQQKQLNSNQNSLAFDRIRFAKPPTEHTNQTDSDPDIIIESSVSKSSNLQSWSGFLIDNCDDVQTSPASSPRFDPASSIVSSAMTESSHENQRDSNHAQPTILVNELNAAHAEQKKTIKRQKRLQKRVRRKNRSSNDRIDMNKNMSTESPSNRRLLEYDRTNKNDQLSQLIDTVEQISSTSQHANQFVPINFVLKQIKQQQVQLKKLSQYVSSILDNHEPTNSTNESQNILTNFLNQPLTSGCWLCSGKTYTEIAIQCDNLDE